MQIKNKEKFQFRIVSMKGPAFPNPYILQYKKKKFLGSEIWRFLECYKDLSKAIEIYEKLVSKEYTVIDGEVAEIIKMN